MILVMQRDYREMKSTAAFRIMLGISGFVTAGASIGISIALRLQSWYGVKEAAPFLDLIISLVVYFLPLFILLAFTWGFASIQITNEKVNGNIECLLAAPLSPRALWMGKCLAVFVPSYLVSAAASLIVIAVLNFAAILPGWGFSVIPIPALITGLVVNPLLFFALLAFLVLFSLANNPDIAVAPTLVFGFGLMVGMPVGLITGAFNIASCPFTLWYLVGTITVWMIVFYLSRLLTLQNIVLSSKGS
jgi:ABC-type Na+ efflux pump permease subunit